MTHLIDLSVALGSYDHTREVASGEVAIAGTRPAFVDLPVAEIARGWIAEGAWDVAELSLVKHAALRSAGRDEWTALPVFPSRAFRHGAIYVRADRIGAPADLRGARVGIPEWANSAGVWARGLLADEHGVLPAEAEWWQGRADALAPPRLPEGVVLRSTRDDLEELLLAGDLDALIAPAVGEAVRGSVASGGPVRRLFADVPAAERATFARTGFVPPMHAVVVRRAVLGRHPWIATNAFRAFEVAKRRYFGRLSDISASRTAIPWAAAYVAELRATFGGRDPWPYGLEPNRRALEELLRHCAEQGLLAGDITPDDLFADVETYVDDAAL